MRSREAIDADLAKWDFARNDPTDSIGLPPGRTLTDLAADVPALLARLDQVAALLESDIRWHNWADTHRMAMPAVSVAARLELIRSAAMGDGT